MKNLPGSVLWREYTEIPVEDSEPHTNQEGQDIHEDTIIHSDSMAAIKILAQTKRPTYPEITTKMINSASALSQRGSLTTLYWVPSHTTIEGNERADALANEATNLTNILHTEQTAGVYKHIITEYLHKQITPNQDTAKLSTWYNKTTVPGIHIINNRIADVHIRRLPWVHTKSFVGPNNKALTL